MKSYYSYICYIYSLVLLSDIVITLRINNGIIYNKKYNNYLSFHNNNVKTKKTSLNLSYELRPHNIDASNGMRSLILDDFNQILEAISIFIDINGDSNIPNKFEVPAQMPWPSSLHGLRLGM